MKKVLSLILVLVLTLSLVACTSDNADEGAPNDQVVENGVGIEAEISVQAESDWLAYYEAAVERVKEDHPNATINIIETGSFDHLDVLDATDVTNKDVADVFSIPLDRIYGLSNNEALAAIDANGIGENVGGYDNYDEGLGGYLQIDGEYLGFPMNIETLINFTNAKNAEDSGIDLDTTIEFTELGGEDMLIPVFDAWFAVALTNAADIELLEKDDQGNLYSDLTKDFSDLTSEKQDVFNALFDYWKFHKDAGTSLWDADAAWSYMDTQFETGGNTSIRLEGPWSTGNLSNLAGNGEDLRLLPISQVRVAGNPLSHWQGGWGIAVNARAEADADKMALAAALIEEIVNTDYAVEFFQASGKILPNVDISVYADSDLSEIDKKVIEAVMDSYDTSIARPLFTEWGSVWDTWENSILSWSSVNPATAEEAYGLVKASFDSMMGNF